MAVSRIEECTIGELSNRVAATNAREDRAADARHARLVKETTERIMKVISPTYYAPPHPWSDGAKGCAFCCYPKEHPVHHGTPSS